MLSSLFCVFIVLLFHLNLLSDYLVLFLSCPFAVSVLAAMKPATGCLRMLQSHGIATRTFKNGTHKQFGTGLVQPGKETNENSYDIYTFWPCASGEYGPPFELNRQILDAFHWPYACVSHVSAAENRRSPRTFWTTDRTRGPAFLDLGISPLSPHNYD